ncbi:MAG: 1-deoxy-D-xylulose-5-phosphate synthase [Methylacidiphilales bacterium]|nr:1-deoxy-D-xylulose-5-phosphate synthase [Candidatus Methylacidiphilales bacterium]
MSSPLSTPLLDTIHAPSDLKKLSLEELTTLCHELKEFLIHSVSKSGGHLASSLGALELTVAVHFVFNTPEDILVWDVGHQSYIHKILTGRKSALASIRSFKGISGFPKKSESIYDTFDVGHAGTSISAGLGMAIALRRLGKNQKVIVIIGDGGLTAGMAFEALNHAGILQENILIIQNDNNMSISHNVGALHKSMNTISSFYHDVRIKGHSILESHPQIKAVAKKFDEQALKLLQPHNLFTSLGFDYRGPIDGHSLSQLIQSLQSLAETKSVAVLHVVTKKGHGYKLAEQDPIHYHGVKPFNQEIGLSKETGKKTFSDIFAQWLQYVATVEQTLVVITPAMIEGSGLRSFATKFPDRLFDVGIAEQHAITLAGGMASQGLLPVVAIYSTFLQRGYDQCLHDILLQNHNVLFAIDRAGLVGGDGATHHGIYDIGFLLPLPNTLIMTPSDEEECWKCLTTGFKHPGPAFVRYPRGSGIGKIPSENSESFELGTSRLLCEGSKLAILGFGPLTHHCLALAQNLGATLVDMRFVKPLNTALLDSLIKSHSYFVTLEDHVVEAGAGTMVGAYFSQQQNKVNLLCLGIPETIIEHGEPSALYASISLDEASIATRITEWFSHV